MTKAPKQTMPREIWVGYYPDDGYTGESFDADTFDDGHNRTKYHNTDQLIERLRAERVIEMHSHHNTDVLQTIDDFISMLEEGVKSPFDIVAGLEGPRDSVEHKSERYTAGMIIAPASDTDYVILEDAGVYTFGGHERRYFAGAYKVNEL